VSGFGQPNYRHPDPLHDADAGAVPVLLGLLRDARPHMRRYAAGKLGAIGPAARSAVPALVELLRDEEADRDADGFDRSVRPTAAWALGRIDPEAAGAAGGAP
jgi:HEAT repeat protein